MAVSEPGIARECRFGQDWDGKGRFRGGWRAAGRTITEFR